MAIDSDATGKVRKRISFTPDEDERLRRLVARFGDKDWGRIAEKFPKRDRRQCRERWCKYLAPTVHNGPWTPAEDDLLRHTVSEMGCRWTSIQAAFPGRTDINLKNHWKQMKKWDTMYQLHSNHPPVPSEQPEPKESLNDFLDSLIQNGEYPDPAGGFGFCFFW
jgi:hypothetical protein